MHLLVIAAISGMVGGVIGAVATPWIRWLCWEKPRMDREYRAKRDTLVFPPGVREAEWHGHKVTLHTSDPANDE